MLLLTRDHVLSFISIYFYSNLLTSDCYIFRGFLYSTDDVYVTGRSERVSRRYLVQVERLPGIRQVRIPNQTSKQFVPCT